jgi:hypothetical protein
MVIERVGEVVLAFHRLLFGYRWDLPEVVWDLFISSTLGFVMIGSHMGRLPKLLRIEKT